MFSWRLIQDKLFRGFSWSLFSYAMILSVSGIYVIASAQKGLSVNFAEKQTVWLMISVLMMFLVVWIGYRKILSFCYSLYFISLILLFIVIVSGLIRSGSQRWIALGPFILQPSELAKIATVLVLAQYLGDRPVDRAQLMRFFVAILIALTPMAFILKQPDLGTSLVFIPILVSVLFLWGARIRYFLIIGLGALASLPIFWSFLHNYQKNRLLMFVNPYMDPLGAGYTAIQSKIAVGSGMLTGKGYMAGSQNQLDFLPQHHTDFIFAVVAEEFGYLGCLALFMVFMLLFFKIIQVMERTTEIRARLVAAGILAMISFHVLINTGMTFGIMPITGLPLPFFSYGGSSLMSMFIALGLLLSIHKERSIFS